MRILVTGASGFIGSNIIKKLSQRNHEIIAIGSRSENIVPNVDLFLSTHFQGVDWKRIPSVDAVIHLAANNDTLCQDKSEMMISNVEGTKLLLEKMYKKGCKKFICASSTAIYGNEPAPYKEDFTKCNPLNIYAKSKAIMEDDLRKFSNENKDAVTIALRYCNVYGPGELHKGKRASMIYQLLLQMLSNQNPKLFEHGEQKRDWIYVEDVVRANLLALKYNKSNWFNCGGGCAYSFNQIVNCINEELETTYSFPRKQPEYIKNPYKKTFQSHTECDMQKIKDELGFIPLIGIKKGIKKYVKHLKKMGHCINTTAQIKKANFIKNQILSEEHIQLLLDLD
jgi:ADP-L-glycero-D-manno-heptose 6-epimerase